MDRCLIVSADDFGLGPRHNEAIGRGIEAGVIRSTGVLGNGPAAAEAAALGALAPAVSVGIHFNLTEGAAVSDPAGIPDLVDGEGRFLGPGLAARARRGRLPRDQVIRELSAQVERLRALGLRLSHWDSHQHVHMIPSILSAAVEVAGRYGIRRMRGHRHFLLAVRGRRGLRVGWHLATHPARLARYAAARVMMWWARRQGMTMPDRLVVVGVLDAATKGERETWQALFRCLPEGISEIHCHPVLPESSSGQPSPSEAWRHREARLLTDGSLADEARAAGVRLVSFYEIGS